MFLRGICEKILVSRQTASLDLQHGKLSISQSLVFHKYPLLSCTMSKRRTDNTMAKRRTDNTMAKRRRTDNTMSKRRTDNTMAKRRRADNIMTKRRTDNTMTKRRRTNNDLQYKTLHRKKF
jgi:hypothetical protein